MMRALGLPTADWTRIYLPQPEAGARWSDDGSFIRQAFDWATALLNSDHVSPSAVEMLGERLLSLGRSRIGAPAPVAEPPLDNGPVAAAREPEISAVDFDARNAALRERARLYGAAAIAAGGDVPLVKVERWLAGKALGYRELGRDRGMARPDRSRRRPRAGHRCSGGHRMTTITCKRRRLR